ncbi:hypothetical protein FRC02_011336 [Tulasnella sp. 418]|nr:hypothetical protein FRC02_011336 [Tulasnella sp. 418]
MSFHSISSTYPEPATSPSPRSSPIPHGPIHAPLRRTYAFYIPRKISAPAIRLTQSNSITSKSRRTKTRRCKGGQPTRSSLRAWKKARDDRDEELQSELEKTMAPPAKRRKIKEDYSSFWIM